MTPNEFYPTLASRYSVYLGAHNISAALKMTEPSIRIPAVYIHIHAEYNLDGRKLNDIAIIKLAREVDLDKNIQLACLPDASKPDYPNRYEVEAFAMGWGAVDYESQYLPELLQNVALELLDGQRQCFLDQQQMFDWRTQICAGVLNGGKDTCQGF